jgi:hypothetical protein
MCPAAEAACSSNSACASRFAYTPNTSNSADTSRFAYTTYTSHSAYAPRFAYATDAADSAHAPRFACTTNAADPADSTWFTHATDSTDTADATNTTNTTDAADTTHATDTADATDSTRPTHAAGNRVAIEIVEVVDVDITATPAAPPTPAAAPPRAHHNSRTERDCRAGSVTPWRIVHRRIRICRCAIDRHRIVRRYVENLRIGRFDHDHTLVFDNFGFDRLLRVAL